MRHYYVSQTISNQHSLVFGITHCIKYLDYLAHFVGVQCLGSKPYGILIIIEIHARLLDPLLH